MNSLDVSGKTIEEATKKALSQLNASEDEVEIVVLNEGKGGILGLGAEEARIRVTLKSKNTPEDQEINIVKDILEELLNRMAVRATINTGFQENYIADESIENPVIFNVVGDDPGILIGHRGQTLDAIQYLTRLIASKRTKLKRPIMVDVENYKQRHYEDLRTLALNVAAQVKSKKTSLRLEPMSAFERRIIHISLADDPDVATESVGEGDARKVVIMPKGKLGKN